MKFNRPYLLLGLILAVIISDLTFSKTKDIPWLKPIAHLFKSPPLSQKHLISKIDPPEAKRDQIPPSNSESLEERFPVQDFALNDSQDTFRAALPSRVYRARLSRDHGTIAQGNGLAIAALPANEFKTKNSPILKSEPTSESKGTSNKKVSDEPTATLVHQTQNSDQEKEKRLGHFDFHIWSFRPGKDGKGKIIPIVSSDLNVLTRIIASPPEWRISRRMEDDLSPEEANQLAPQQLISLGYAGELILEINGFLRDESGPDLMVYENKVTPTESGNATYEETATIAVAEGIPTAENSYKPGPFYSLGKGGLNAAGDAFDLAVVSHLPENIRFIQIKDDTPTDPLDNDTTVIHEASPSKNNDPNAQNAQPKKKSYDYLQSQYKSDQTETVPTRIEKFSGFDLDSVVLLHAYNKPEE